MKKVLSIVLTAIMLISFAACSSQPKPETFIVGDWECISIIGNNRERLFTENFFKMTVNRDGNATFTQEEAVAEYTWLFDSYDESSGLCEYSFNTEGTVSKVYHDAEKDTMILYEKSDGKAKAAIFRKAGTDILVKEDTVYTMLLGMDFDMFGLEYLQDGRAYDMVAGSWMGVSLITADETTTLWPGSLSMELADNRYSITMIDEKREGNMKFMGNLEHMPTYTLDGDYEGTYLAYDEDMDMLVIYDEASDVGLRFVRG